jgi:multidrug efflux pump subunit AcrA (membrane-fusion protein)
VNERMPLTRIAEIEQHLAATTNWSLGNLAARDLLAELYAVRAELRVARGRVAELEAERHERVLVPRREYELMEAQRERAATAEARTAELEAAQVPADEDPDDNRRRLYIDGKGNGWISLCHDEGTEWVVPVQPEGAVEQDVRDIAHETGSIREIGRCW